MQNHINYLDFENLSRNLNMQPANKDIMLSSVIDGFSKGNMDEELYDPYRNYRPVRLNENDPDIMMRAYLFAIIDLQLYLDVHPDDLETKKLFNKYVENFDKLKKQVESKNGPLYVTSTYNLTPNWIWQKDWPFEGENK